MKAVVIGAASANFGPVSVYDLLSTVLSSDGELALVDVRETELRQMAEFAALLARRVGSDARVTWSTDRTEVLKRADTVIVSAEVDRLAAWEADWEIPHRYGIGHTLGENRGPAGLSHTLRTAPLVVAIARDIERMAPDAVMFIMTNPEDRLAYAVRAYTSVDAIGYCDGLWDFRDHVLGPALDMRGEDIYVDGAGINHAVWIRSLIDTRTGSDLYPRLREAGTHGFQPLGQHLYRRFGLWPHENDEHYGEYFPYAAQFLGATGFDFEGYRRLDSEWKERIAGTVAGRIQLDATVDALLRHHHEVFGDAPPSVYMQGLCGGRPAFVPNANLPNDGKIRGLPDDIIVELPAIATPSGVHGIGSIDLPQAILAFLYREGTIQKLSAEAAVEGSRSKALLALELDPHVPSPTVAEQLLDDFLRAHGHLIDPTILASIAAP